MKTSSSIDDVKNVAKTFFVEPASSAAGDGGNGGAGGDGGAGGAGGGDGSIPPEPKKQKVSSNLEERQLKRLAKSKASNNASSSPSPVTTVRRSAIIEKEMRMYLAEDPHLEENDFSLLQFWLRSRSEPSTCAETGEVEAGLPYLALIARLYNGIESTSCQAESNSSALSFLIGSLRSSISPGKVERLMFLRLSRLFIAEVKALHDAIEANKAAAARCKEKVAQVEGAMANTALVLNL